MSREKVMLPGDPVIVERLDGWYVILVPCAGREMSPACAGPIPKEVAEKIAQAVREENALFDAEWGTK